MITIKSNKDYAGKETENAPIIVQNDHVSVITQSARSLS